MESKKEEQNFELIKYKLDTLTKSMERVNKFLDEEAIRRIDFEKLQTSVGDKATRAELEMIRGMVEKKLDKEDFQPYKDTLTKINWVIITAVIAGVLALIINVK